MSRIPEHISISIPAWVADYANTWLPDRDIAVRMRFVINAAQRSVIEGTGGPFAAAVFDEQSGELVSLGVNLVTSGNLSTLHAEMVALMLAEQRLQSWDLSLGGTARHALYTTAEPCAMCYGALPWSGIVRLVTAARHEDTQQIGFDEGPHPADWISPLQERGIVVQTEVLRTEAVAVLEMYRSQCGVIYNPVHS